MMYQMYQRTSKQLEISTPSTNVGLPLVLHLFCIFQAKQPPNQWLNYLQKAFRIAKEWLRL